MKVITKRQLISGVAEKWAMAYTPFERHYPDKLQIYMKLLRLDLSTVSEEEVTQIIGNGSWTSLRCGECGEHVDWILRIGEEPDYESSTAYICKDCLAKASKLLTEC